MTNYQFSHTSTDGKIYASGPLGLGVYLLTSGKTATVQRPAKTPSFRTREQFKAHVARLVGGQ